MHPTYAIDWSAEKSEFAVRPNIEEHLNLESHAVNCRAEPTVLRNPISDICYFIPAAVAPNLRHRRERKKV